jgi:hypothetical protein
MQPSLQTPSVAHRFVVEQQVFERLLLREVAEVARSTRPRRQPRIDAGSASWTVSPNTLEAPFTIRWHRRQRRAVVARPHDVDERRLRRPATVVALSPIPQQQVAFASLPDGTVALTTGRPAWSATRSAPPAPIPAWISVAGIGPLGAADHVRRQHRGTAGQGAGLDVDRVGAGSARSRPAVTTQGALYRWPATDRIARFRDLRRPVQLPSTGVSAGIGVTGWTSR